MPGGERKVREEIQQFEASLVRNKSIFSSLRHDTKVARGARARVAGGEEDLLGVGRVELVQALHEVAVVEHGPSALVGLVEDVVREEHEQVAPARLAPLGAARVLRSVEDRRAQVQQRAQEPASRTDGARSCAFCESTHKSRFRWSPTWQP